MKYIYLILLCISLCLLTACPSASNKQLSLAQDSIKAGHYLAAFDQAAASLQADIGNFKTVTLFPQVTRQAYQQQLAKIATLKTQYNLDATSYAYDRVIAMNQMVQSLQQRLQAFSVSTSLSKKNQANAQALLQLQSQNVDAQRHTAYMKSAEAHYQQGERHAAINAYRLAAQSFNKSLSFIPTYQDAVTKAYQFKHLADLEDAEKYYVQGVAYVQSQQHRAAAHAFSKALSFVPSYKDAISLASKYKNIADQEDAAKAYQEGQRLVAQLQYRSAAKSFQQALHFVVHYRDATQLVEKYKQLADLEDARKNYAQAENYMAQQNFAEAARFFEKASTFVYNFNDSRSKAKKARSYIPPANYAFKKMIQDSFAGGFPSHFTKHRYAEVHDIKIKYVTVVEHGRFDMYAQYWPYTIRVRGSFEYYTTVNGVRTEQTEILDQHFYFHIIKTSYRGWTAKVK